MIRISFLLGLLLLALTPALKVGAAEGKLTPDQKEAAEAKAEEEAEIAEKGEEVKMIFEGKLELNQVEEGKEPPAVVGTFTSEGKSYGLKLKRAELYNDIKKFDGKEIVLIGRPRNGEKYFVASNVQTAGAAPRYTRPRGSL